MNKYKAAIDAILQTKNLADAAKLLQLDVSTLYRYRAKPEFQTLLAQRRRELVADTYTRLAGLSGRAVETLEALMASGTSKDTVRLRAVQTAIESLLELYKYVDIAKELAEVKALLLQQGHTNAE